MPINRHEDDMPSTAKNTYKHTPFEKLGQIRLVVLNSLKDSPDGRFYCKLIHVDLDHPPEYEAISYTWGTSLQANQVTVLPAENGPSGTIRVTKSLIEVFAQLRMPDKTRTLWIDQISIDQANWEEKRDQIHYMYRVYQSAAKTIIWLGEETPEALESLNAIKAFSSLENGQEFKTTNVILEELYNRRWRSRIWCIQELCFSKEPIVMLGPHTSDWKSIADTCSYTATSWLGYEPQHNGLLMERYRAKVQAGKRLDMLPTMAETRRFECTEPADRLAAIAGLSAHGTQGADIGREQRDTEIRRLWVGFIAMYIEYAVDGNWPSTLDSICHAGTRNAATPNWPSWAADWTWERARERPPEPYFSANLHRFNASRGRSLGNLDLRRRMYHYNALTVKGRAVDTVLLLGARYPTYNLELAPELLQWWQLAVRCWGNTYVNGEYLKKAFSRTVVADYFLENEPELLPEYNVLHLECCIRLGENVFPPEWPWLKPCIERLGSVYFQKLIQACRGQRFFVTKKGYMGLCPPETQPGDIIAVLYGGKGPFILRPSSARLLKPRIGEDEKFYLDHRVSIEEGAGRVLIGDCYVEGIMQGEALGWDGEDTQFVIV